jgi:hypothetical protein
MSFTCSYQINADKKEEDEENEERNERVDSDACNGLQIINEFHGCLF